MEGSSGVGSSRPLKNQFSVQEWESLIEDFHYGGTRRDRWTSQLSSPLSLIDLSLSSFFRKDFPVHLKLNLLIFIEEFIADLSTFNSFCSDSSDQLLSKLIEFLQVVIQSPNDGVSITFALKEQMLVSVTSITISLPYSSHHTSHISHLESLIAVLLTIVNRPNHGIDRQTRAVACECLRQLEREYPGLLSDIVGHLWGLCQNERTHASQSYMLLLLEVIHHIVVNKLSVSSIVSTAIPLVPFSVPYWIRTSEIGQVAASLDDEVVRDNLGRELSVSIIKELRRVMAFLLEWPQVLTPPGMMEFLSLVLPVAVDLDLQVSLLKVQFFGLLYTSDPLLWHVVLMLYSRFSDAFDGLEDVLIRRLTLISREGQQHLVFRLLVLHWLKGFVGSRIITDVGKMRLIANKGFSFYPHVFDALALKALKLDLLALCSIFIGSVWQRGSTSILSQEGISDATVVNYFEDGMICLSTFRGLPPWSTETAVAFRTFHKFLIGSSIHSDSDPSITKALMESIIFHNMQRMFVKLLLDFDKLVYVVVALIDRLLGCHKHRWLGDKLLQTFDAHLLPKVAISSKMISYFPIFDKIGKNESIPPCQLLELLVKLMVFLVDKHGPDSELKSWSLASKVLGICRTMLMHHHSSRLFIGLSHLLAFTSLYFPDLEVRDNARIYLRMLVCIPGKKLRNLLSAGEQILGVAQPAHESSMYDVQSPWLLVDLRKSKSISSYIHLERVVSLLVKQSWSLSLPALCCGSDKFGFVGGIKDPGPSSDGRDYNDENQAEPDVKRIDQPQEPLRVMDSQVSDMLGILRKHFSCIPDFRHMAGLKINIPCALRFNSEAFERVWGVNSTGNSLSEGDKAPAMYAIVLRFSSSAPYGSMPSYHIPFLIGETFSMDNVSTRTYSLEIVPLENGTTEKDFVKTPVTLELNPHEPVPGLVDVSIEANTEDGRIIRGQLQSVSVGIEDMFLKAMVPPDIPEITVPDYYCELFNALWEACGASSSIGREMFSLKGGKGFASITGTRSVKLLEVPVDFVLCAVRRYLAPFVVCVIGEPLIEVVKDGGILKNVIWKDFSPDTALGSNAQLINSNGGPLYLAFNDEDDGNNVNAGKTNMGCFLVLIFLPPRYHLLFQMEVSDISTLVRMRTDHWPCLAYVDDYLEALFSS